MEFLLGVIAAGLFVLMHRLLTAMGALAGQTGVEAADPTWLMQAGMSAVDSGNVGGLPPTGCENVGFCDAGSTDDGGSGNA